MTSTTPPAAPRPAATRRDPVRITSAVDPNRRRITPGRVRGPLLGAAVVALTVVAALLVARAAIEPFLIDPTTPATYRHDWGGPSLAGVLAVHCGPGLVGLVWLSDLRRTRRAWRAGHAAHASTSGTR